MATFHFQSKTGPSSDLLPPGTCRAGGRYPGTSGVTARAPGSDSLPVGFVGARHTCPVIGPPWLLDACL